MFVALLALMISLSGASVAAVMIHGKQIKKNTVSSAQIKNKTIKRKDVSPKARRQFKGRTGATGPEGPAGPSNAYSVSNDNNTVMTSTRKSVLTLDLPAGSYVVNSKAVAKRNESGVSAYARCQLMLNNEPGLKDFTAAYLPADSATLASMASQMVFTSEAAATVALVCYGASASLSWKKVTAIKVGSVSSVTGLNVS